MNNLESYSINSVERLTGIKAHTLRIWEKRYKSLIPHRTDTNIRYYDDEQLRNLINISTLLNQGYKISVLMGMSAEGVNDLILKLGRSSETNGLFEVHTGSLVNHMLAFDEPAFDKVFSSVIIRYGIYEAMIKVVYPFLRKTGLLWSVSNVTPAQEHFASSIIKRKLFSAIDGIPFPDKPEKRFILFLPPGEWHEIGLLFSDYLIRSSGAASLYLGQSVPYESLDVTISKNQPDYIFTILTSGTDNQEHINRISEMCEKYLHSKFLVSTRTEYKDTPPNLAFIRSTEDIFSYL